VAALLLRLAGVATEDIAEDYSLSGANLAPTMDPWLDAAEDEHDRRRRKKLGATPASAMRRVLEELERRYGGVAAYAEAGGVSPEQLERLRTRLR
jgi:protein-tyrosine phosphatase